MAKDKTVIGITGKPIPKPRTAKQQYELEKKRRMQKHLGQNVGGYQYSSDVTPYYNPRARTFEEFMSVCEAKVLSHKFPLSSDERKTAERIGKMADSDAKPVRQTSAPKSARKIRKMDLSSIVKEGEEQINEMPYQIYGPGPHGPSDAEPQPLGKPYKNKKRAKTRADKLDQEIGGYRHFVRKVDEGWKPADTGKMSSQAYKLEKQGDPHYKVLDTAIKHLSASKTKSPTTKNVVTRNMQSARLNRNIDRSKGEITRHGATSDMRDPKVQKKVIQQGKKVSDDTIKKKSIKTVSNMQSRRKPSEQEMQSAVNRFDSTYHNSKG